MATEINPDMIELIKNTNVDELGLEELKVFISKADVVYRPIEPSPGSNGDRSQVLNQMWKAQKLASHIVYDPMLEEIKVIMRKYSIDPDNDDGFGFGLDHLGESCPPN